MSLCAVLRSLARLRVLVLVIALTLDACGFKPVTPATLRLEGLYVNTGAYASFGSEFRRYVESYSKTQLADNPSSAKLILEIVGEAQQQQILSLNIKGTVQEYLLRYQVTYRVKDQAGHEIVPETTIALVRAMTYDVNVALAKDNEAVFLYRDMKLDAVQQLVRRLSTIDLTPRPSAS
jgi:LPS-assembly lipoprotein